MLTIRPRWSSSNGAGSEDVCPGLSTLKNWSPDCNHLPPLRPQEQVLGSCWEQRAPLGSEVQHFPLYQTPAVG